MSCCALPEKSSEPEYPVHPALERIVAAWEPRCPGVFQAVSETIGCGDWDAQDGIDVPPYSLEGAFRVAGECLAQQLLKVETTRQIKRGPLLVRMGLVKPSTTLSADGQAFAEEGQRQVSNAYQELASAQQTDPYSKGATSIWNWSSGPMKITA